uniref:UBL3-like ubiquitin domain-containing protein n=1 Tax=Attheya septentrionalis TaxID=420275 RepID=A0A7S2USI7_9STRA|mmetsp:Transcript_7489/g.13484  ORF Transcript_7489/g.13484 Transcript_7489/m.13484 type:complete len:244 (+) Transcript_7489:423-1154(+)
MMTSTNDDQPNGVAATEVPAMETPESPTAESMTKETRGSSGPQSGAATQKASEVPSQPSEKEGEAKSTATELEALPNASGNASPKSRSPKPQSRSPSTGMQASASFVYNPDKISLRFLFANRDGLTLTINCDPGDTVGEIKGALLSVWPDELKECSGGDNIRLICMGKGILMPDSRTLEDCQIPTFRTHATPVNVSVRPEKMENVYHSTKKPSTGARSSTQTPASPRQSGTNSVETGCACAMM